MSIPSGSIRPAGRAWLVIVLAAGLATGPVAGRAAPPPAPEGFARTWERALRRYNHRVLLEMLASEFPAGSPEAGRLAVLAAQAGAPGPEPAQAGPGATTRADDHRGRILARLEEEFAARRLDRGAVDRSLDWFMATYLELGPVTLPALEPGTGGRPERFRTRRGFEPRVRAIDRDATHSMDRLERYLELQVGREIVGLLQDSRSVIALTLLGQPEAVTFLTESGYSRIYEVNAAGFSRRKRSLLGHDPRRDRVCLVHHGFASASQLLNHQARFWFLGRGGLIPGSRMVTLEGEPAEEFPGAGSLETWLAGDPRPVDTFYAGLVNPLRHLVGNTRRHRFGDLVVIDGERPSIGGPRRFLALSGFGAFYGTLPARLVAILRRYGLRRVVFFGTAGGLAGVGSIHRWVVPGRVMEAGAVAAGDGPVRPFVNRGAELALEGAVVGGLHATVLTPLLETRPRVRALVEQGVVSVDCELAHLVTEVTRGPEPLEMIAALIVTDRPRSGPGDDPAPAGAIDTTQSPVQQRRVRAAHARLLTRLFHRP